MHCEGNLCPATTYAAGTKMQDLKMGDRIFRSRIFGAPKRGVARIRPRRAGAVAARGRGWDRETDRRTDTQPLHRRCSAYCSGIASKASLRYLSPTDAVLKYLRSVRSSDKELFDYTIAGCIAYGRIKRYRETSVCMSQRRL